MGKNKGNKSKQLETIAKLVNAGVITSFVGMFGVMSTLGLASNAEISRGEIIDKKDLVIAQSLSNDEYMQYVESRRDELNQANLDGEISDNKFLQEIKYLRSYNSVRDQKDILSESLQEKIEEISQDEQEVKAKGRRTVYHLLANSALGLIGAGTADYFRKKYSKLQNKSSSHSDLDEVTFGQEPEEENYIG